MGTQLIRKGIKMKKSDVQVDMEAVDVKHIKDFSSVASMTQENGHMEALIEAATIIGAPARFVLAKLVKISQLAEMDGHLDSNLSEYRYTQYKMLKHIAKIHLTIPEYNNFDSSL